VNPRLPNKKIVLGLRIQLGRKRTEVPRYQFNMRYACSSCYLKLVNIWYRILMLTHSFTSCYLVHDSRSIRSIGRFTRRQTKHSRKMAKRVALDWCHLSHGAHRNLWVCDGQQYQTSRHDWSRRDHSIENDQGVRYQTIICKNRQENIGNSDYTLVYPHFSIAPFHLRMIDSGEDP
jgi:hypothetical protein